MCYHYSLIKTVTEVLEHYKIPFDPVDGFYNEVYHMNGFDFSKMAVITSDAPQQISRVYWGLIPRWVKDVNQANEMKARTLNAKSETVFELPSFRSPIQTNRCLVIADGFYEWRTFNKKKYPYYITLKNHTIFSMAGICDSWIDKTTGEEIKTFSILTCAANALMAKIHNGKERMPVILPKEFEKEWLNTSLKKEEIKAFLKTFPEEKMEAYPISKLITSRTDNPNGKEIVLPFSYPELGEL